MAKNIDSSLNLSKRSKAFVLSVSTASAVLTLFLAIRSLCGGFESATTNAWTTKLEHLVQILTIAYLIGWLFAFIFSLVPFLIGIFIARLANISSPTFFIVGAALTGALLAPVVAMIPNFGFNVQEELDDSVWDQFVYLLPLFIACGGAAGFVCWKVLKRPEPDKKA